MSAASISVVPNSDGILNVKRLVASAPNSVTAGSAGDHGCPKG